MRVVYKQNSELYLRQADRLPGLGPRRVAEGGELVGVPGGEVELEGLDDEVLALGLRLEQRLAVHFLRRGHYHCSVKCRG